VNSKAWFAGAISKLPACLSPQRLDVGVEWKTDKRLLNSTEKEPERPEQNLKNDEPPKRQRLKPEKPRRLLKDVEPVTRA
tara:strand:+ start:4068 stop:4307 length:240 start_codon:yes stop_codon:yes gene_type:complete